MSKEVVNACLCAAGGVMLLLVGFFVPAHFRAVDWEVLKVAGAGTSTRVAVANDFLREGALGPATLLFRAAAGRRGDTRTGGLEAGGNDEAAKASDAGLVRVAEVLSEGKGVGHWGRTNAWLDACCESAARAAAGSSAETRGEFEVGIPVLRWLLPAGGRQALARALSGSSDAAVIALLEARGLRETTILPPVATASGQPLEAGLLLAAAMAETGRGKTGVLVEFERGAMTAMQGRGSAALESLILDLLAAARFFDWEQVGTLLDRCEDGPSLHRLVVASAGDEARWASLFALTAMAGGARRVSEYVSQYGDAGLRELERAMELGSGSIHELLKESHRIHEARLRMRVVRSLGLERASDWVVAATQKAPTLALVVRYLFWLDGLFLLVLSLWWARRGFLTETNRRFQPRPDWISVGVVAGTLAVGIFLVSERFLGVQYEAATRRAAAGLPVLRARVRFDMPPVAQSPMKEKIIGMLVLFFVVQFAIYLIGLSRLRHIRGQGVDGSVKLKLLDNEESMFDAPLYLGIAGSVLALVLRLSGFGDVSLMASYSSTLFGILFCFIMKVMHVRPYRQQLILEASEQGPS